MTTPDRHPGALQETEINLKTHTAYAGSEATQITAAVKTIDQTTTTIWEMTLPENTCVFLDAKIVAREAQGVGRAAYQRMALVYRATGDAAFQGSVIGYMTIETDANWNATFTVSGGAVRLQVYGGPPTAPTIYWVAKIEYQLVATDS